MTLLPLHRYTLGPMTVYKVTTYNKTLADAKCIDQWRYAMRGPDGNRYVYTGVYRRMKVGDIVWMRATVKEVNDKYGYTRLSRVRLVERPAQERLI